MQKDSGTPKGAKKRLVEWDVAKFIAVVCVVVGHCSYLGEPAWLVDAIFSFHMPFFFVASGYFMKERALTPQLVRKEARGLLLPYVVTSLLIVLCAGAFACIVPGYPALDAMRLWAKAALFGYGGVTENMLVNVPAIGAIWFLLALFISKVLFYATSGSKAQPLFFVGFFVLGLWSQGIVFLPWSIQPALTASAYVYLGFLLKKYGVLEWLWNHALAAVAVIVLAAINAAFFGHYYMVINAFNDGVAINFLGGLCGAVALVLVCKAISTWLPKFADALAHPGQHTLAIFCMHLVELDGIDWVWVMSHFAVPEPSLWVVVLLARSVVIAIFCWFAYVIKPLALVYFPGSASKREKSVTAKSC